MSWAYNLTELRRAHKQANGLENACFASRIADSAYVNLSIIDKTTYS